MSWQIIKAGLFDTVQDLGRYGYQHQGINPGGAMDRFSAALANALLGKELTSPVVEMHFPAPQMLFEEDSIICLTGANFTPQVDGVGIPLHQPVLIKASSMLSFAKPVLGVRCYLAVYNQLQLQKWLGSYSTNLKAGAGGWKGRKLERGDQLVTDSLPALVKAEPVSNLPWRYNTLPEESTAIHFLPGPEWDWLTEESKEMFLHSPFRIGANSDRMGYRLEGTPLLQQQKEQLVSSAVSFGTVQLLPNGQAIILMADHQTTGGYPRIASVITAHLPRLAQMKPTDEIRFEATDLPSAQTKWVAQQKILMQLQQTCYQKMQNWLYAH